MAMDDVKEWAESSVYLDLPEDGSEAEVIFVGSPRLVTTRGRYGLNERAVFPVMTPHGVRLFGTSRRTARSMLSAMEKANGLPVRIVRVGEAGSSATRYIPRRGVEDKELLEKAKAVTDSEIEAAFKQIRGFRGMGADEDEGDLL